MDVKATIAGVLVGVAVGAGVSALPQFSTDKPKRLVSDCNGKLESLCIHYCEAFHDECIDLYADLFQSLGAGTKVYAAVENKTEFNRFCDALQECGALDQVQLESVVTGFPITPWAKDRFGTMRDNDGKPVIALPRAPTEQMGPRGNDGRVPRLLAETLFEVRVAALPFFFDGGDLLADDERAYVANNFLARNQPEDIDNREGLIQRISETLGRKLIVIGQTPADVPDHHIGMYLTPLGDGTVVVGDPDMGIDLLGGAALPGGLAPTRDQAKLEQFRRVIRELETTGLRIVRVPLVPTDKSRVYLTYNNALQETRAGQKRIYMPVYGIPRLDAAATRVFEQEGWHVVPIRVAKVYQYTGSLRCLVGVLERS
jgi:hypothetical protein